MYEFIFNITPFYVFSLFLKKLQFFKEILSFLLTHRHLNSFERERFNNFYHNLEEALSTLKLLNHLIDEKYSQDNIQFKHNREILSHSLNKVYTYKAEIINAKINKHEK
ncbi:hypothetical protein [Staphylococcus agnetis]|uniref:hypothetical protein n=1 Tax=Staphylococcus agnetis TaxID=985762 RepID=UPI0039EA0945